MTDKELKEYIMKEMFHIKDKHMNPYKMHDKPHEYEVELGGEEHHSEGHDEEYDYEGYMAKANLYKAAKAATMMHNAMKDNEELEPWVEEKIAIACDMLVRVADYLEYKKISGK
jgi:hypothetical protein